MRILAIDPGFERVGIAVLERGTTKSKCEKLLYSACFKTSPKNAFSDRLVAVGNEVERIIKKFKPGSLAIETLFFNTNQKTAMHVAESRGVIVFVAAHNKLDIYEYTPLHIKTAITGYGRATKEQVIFMVKKLLKIEPGKRVDDEYDAIAIGLTHFANNR